MELADLGFMEAGEWESNAHIKSGITFKLNDFRNERVIYAFVVDSETKYVGICENRMTTLEDRMRRYKNLQGAGTNKRIAGEIKKCLEVGKLVKIFALRPESSLQYGNLTIDLVKGLENPLIEELKTSWNMQK